MTSEIIFCHAFVEFDYVNNQGQTTCHTSRVTFAANHTESGLTSYAAAWVAPQDNFDRAKGRAIAKSRLTQGSPAHVRPVEIFAGNWPDFWNSVFVDAMGNNPSRWRVTNIRFSAEPNQTEVPAST